jgi:putative DNA primase/helicase
MTTLDAARIYIGRGISVIPLHGPDEPAGAPLDKRGKRPALASWKPYQTRHATDDELVQWFTDGTRNIGIVTGSISRLTVVDFDTKEAIAAAKAKGFPKCPVVKTGKGLHAYCKYSDGHRNFQKRADLPGVDLRAEGGYVVAPPSIHATGRPYEWRTGAGLDELPLPDPPEWLFAHITEGKATIAELHTTTPEGRNISLSRLAGVWIHQQKGITLEGLIEMGTTWSSGLPLPLPQDEVTRTCKSIFDRHHNGASGEDEDANLITDQRLKKQFSELYKNVVRFVPGVGWHQWDGSRWCTNMPGSLYPYIDKMQEKLLLESKQLPEHIRLARRKALIGIESFTRQTTIISACQHEPDLITAADQLDRDNMLLNCQNGTIDLATSNLKEHDPADLITRKVNILYDRVAECPTFLSFIIWAMCGNMELVDYLQRFIGYCLTGKTSEQILNFWYGTGGNGKTTLMNVFQWVLCDYATTADTGLIMTGDTGGTDNNKLYMLATLRGSRLVTLSEVNDGQKLDEAAIKSFTGGDVITARQIYQAGFTYTPQAKLIGFGNYRPHVRGTDHGIWRRIHLVPFRAVISEDAKDPELAAKLKAELPGILAWAVRGCIEWQRIGLRPPAALMSAVKEYRQAEDVFQGWINECCSLDELKRTPAQTLMNSFRDYSGWRGLSDRKFGDLLKGRGFLKVRSNGIHWQGISLENGTVGTFDHFSRKYIGKNSIESYGKNPQTFQTFQNPPTEEIFLNEGDFL